MQDKKVSVIVPVYNVEKYLRKCIDSILAQTYSNIELLLIDDGSKDSSGKICDEYAGRDSRIKVIHKPNGGVSSARNVGIALATGEFIAFLDSDDFISPNMYQLLVTQIEKDQSDISICGMMIGNHTGEYKPYWEENVECILSRQEQLRNLLTNRYYTCSVNEKLFRKEIIASTRFSEHIKQYEDMLFLFQVMDRSTQASYMSEGLYYYRATEGSASRVPFNDSMMGIIDVSEMVTNEIVAKYPELRNVARREFVRNNIMCLQNAARSHYQNKPQIRRMQKNVRKNIRWYLCSDASIGYKVHALVILLGWRSYRLFVEWYGGRKK